MCAVLGIAASHSPVHTVTLIAGHVLFEQDGLKKPLILVAEDNAVNQKVAVRLLDKLNCRTDVVSNGLEAVAAVSRINYDLVLMDCQMPEMDGFEATMELRRREPAGQRIPIVAMTANAMRGDRERCLEVGMDDYIAKPVRRDALEQIIQRYARVSACSPESAPLHSPSPSQANPDTIEIHSL